ncbi:MAG: hypothetical protein M1357_01405 [Candidatus Marsarchaeota archaeon]|nr:hypothetical protein [Candidatus Marsarchaeota archaeon]
MGAMTKKEYVKHLLDDTLGLPLDSLVQDYIPGELVDLVSQAVTEGFPMETDPIVERALSRFDEELERAELEQKGYSIRKMRWPRGASHAVCLTHDVDNVGHPRSHLWRTRSRFGFLDLVLGLTGLRSPYDNVQMITEREKEKGVRSTFFFLSGNYDLNAFAEKSTWMTRNGFEIGLHGDFGTHSSMDAMLSAKLRLESSLNIRVEGVREHYLKFEFPITWEIADEAGFGYDATVGQPDKLCYKVGLCSPFHPPSATWRPLNLLELPLTVMDTTLWGYLKLGEPEGFEAVMSMFDAVTRFKGLFVLLWHQEAIKMRGGRIYWRIVDELLRRGGYLDTASGIAGWWRSRGFPLKAEGGIVRPIAKPPQGLVMRVKLSQGARLESRNCSVEERSEFLLVSPLGDEFEIKVI